MLGKKARPFDPVEALVVEGTQRPPFNPERPVGSMDLEDSAPPRPGRAQGVGAVLRLPRKVVVLVVS
jgi:hypothetical protein